MLVRKPTVYVASEGHPKTVRGFDKFKLNIWKKGQCDGAAVRTREQPNPYPSFNINRSSQCRMSENDRWSHKGDIEEKNQEPESPNNEQ